MVNFRGNVVFNDKLNESVRVVEIVLEAEAIVPGVLVGLTSPQAGNEIVVLSGRAPIWLYGLYGYLIHYYHPSRAIAVFDPRLDGAVIVESHIPHN